ncbi:peptide ABC transporter substrate-binding protein [Streptococcaceae bacterium ESL0729]|nr:peptide ABC transporter substrate-binding protein [Streptococcaceae bacterium ESL0729]
MKKAKLLGFGLLSVAALGTFAACGNKDSKSSSSDKNLAKELKTLYTSDPKTLDYTVAMQRYTAEHTANFVEGLLSYDQYRQLVPALAEKWEVSEDGKTYTYHIRKNVKWVDSEGNEYAEVKPSDWVTGLKHAADSESEALYIVADSVKGLADYAAGKETDFSKVGIKADDDAMTLTYELNNPETFWNSKTTYGILNPINEEFLKSKGDKFGGLSADSLLYNGPFILSSMTDKSEITYKANPTYWDKDNVHVDSVKWTYYDGSKPDSLYDGFKDGKYDSARLYPTMPYFANIDKKDVFWTNQGSGTYYGAFNYNRQNFTNSKKTDQQKEETKKALLNKDFRNAITFSIDKTKYTAQYNGEEGAKKMIRSSLVPSDFVTIAGKDYGDTVQTDLEKRSDVWKGLSVIQQENGTFNAEKAVASFNKAKEALKAEGVEVSAANPIIIDAPVNETNEIGKKAYASLKNSIESTLNNEVTFNVIPLANDPYTQATFSFKTAAEADYDFAVTGWSPDFADPSTYLNIFSPKSGDVFRNLGLDSEVTLKGEDKGVAAKKALDFDKYQELLDTAAAIYDSTDKRYEAYADAEAWLLDNSIIVPIMSDGGSASISRIVPFSGINSNGIGSTAYSYKYLKVGNDTVTAEEYDKAAKTWKEEVEKRSKEAEK